MANEFAAFLRERIEVVEGDVSNPGLGMAPDVRQRLAKTLDVIVNSSGLTDFNPDLRDALATNVRSTAYLLDFLRDCEHASLLHLSTCYVIGKRDGRVLEELAVKLHSSWPREFRRRKRMAIARSSDPRNRSARRIS